MQDHHTRNLGIGLRKLVVWALNIHQICNRGCFSLFFLFTPMFGPKVNMNIYFVYQPHSQMYVCMYVCAIA